MFKLKKLKPAQKKTCVDCFSDPCGCHCGPASFSLGVSLALVYLVGTLVAFFFPSFYSYLGFALFRGSLPVSVGDFSSTTILSGIVSWFLVGVIINGAYFYAKKVFNYK